MWVRIDDGFPEHRKVFAAAELIGTHGYARVSSVWLQGTCYANRSLTDGFLPAGAVRKFHDVKPIIVAQAMVTAGLWELAPGGYQIHDYHDYQPTADEIQEQRRKKIEAGRKGGLHSAAKRVSKQASTH